MKTTTITGIPNKDIKELPPTLTDIKTWDFTIHSHDAEKAQKHFDFRLGDPTTKKTYSWALRNLPQPGEKSLAILQPQHDYNYLDYEGIILEGYGKGNVNIDYKDKVEVLKSTPEKISFVVFKGKTPERYTLIKPTSFTKPDDWLLVNHTPTRFTRPEIPTYKSKYQDISEKDLKFTSNTVLSPKIDGAHTLFILRQGKPIETFSYRPSKKEDQLIDHTFKTDLYKTLAPTTVGDLTIVRGELFSQNKETKKVQPSTTTAGILNAHTLKSRELQQQHPLNNIIYDIDIYHNKDVSKLPFREKFQLLVKINKELPQLSLAPFATTPEEKHKLLMDVKYKQHPLSEEGVVIFPLDEAVPKKYKIKKDKELYIQGFFLPTKNSKYEGKGVGGFYASSEVNSSKENWIRVGSGLTDKLRQDMFQNPNDYLGKKTKVEYQQEYQSGKLRVPVFKELRELW